MDQLIARLVLFFCCASLIFVSLYKGLQATPLEDYLPPDAKNIKDLGNGWMVFEWEDKDHDRIRRIMCFRKHNHFTITELSYGR
jgi:hypothetical protein